MDTDNALAVLELLEAEKKRRIEEKVAAGLLRVVGRDDSDPVVVGCVEEIEEAVQRAEAEALNKYGNNPPLHFDFLVIVTGVVRSRDRYDPERAPPDETGPVYKEDEPHLVRTKETEDDVPTYCAQAQEEAYISLVLDHGDDDGDPGRIAAGWYSVENGSLVLEGLDRRHLGSQLLLEGQDPAAVAKQLLRKGLSDHGDFNRRLHYPRRGVA